MRFRYILYPEAREKLEKSGLLDRIRKADERNELSVGGMVHDDELVAAAKSLKDSGYLDTLSEADRKEYGSKMNLAFKSYRGNTGVHWTINRPDGIYLEGAEPEDFLILMGNSARDLMAKEEMFDYKRFGFDNPTSLVGAVEVAINNAKTNYMNDGYTWESRRPDGRVIVNRIAGSEHMDLRMFQTDITPYETRDLLGNTVPFRPETSHDESNVAGYHSTEPELLASIFKYIQQTGIRPKFMEDNGRELIGWTRSLGQGGGGCAEHFGGFDRSSRGFFIGHQIPLATLNEKYEPQGRCIDHISTASHGGIYSIYVGPQKEFVAAYESNGLNQDRRKAFSLMPDEIDNLVKGLMYQCARGLGRTSAKQMIDMISFRLSPEFEKAMNAIRAP